MAKNESNVGLSKMRKNEIAFFIDSCYDQPIMFDITEIEKQYSIHKDIEMFQRQRGRKKTQQRKPDLR